MIIECANCRAPLDTSGGSKHVKCTYCDFPNVVPDVGAAAEPTPADWKPPSTWTPPKDARAESVPLEYHPADLSSAGGGKSGLVVVLVVGAVAAVIGLGVWLSGQDDPADAAPNSNVVLPPAPSDTVSKSALAEITGDKGWLWVEDTSPPGEPTSFDPIESFPWASSIARAWAGDARIYSIILKRARADGTIDLKREKSDAEYRFLSPARLAAALKMREVSDEKTIETLLMVQVKPEGVKVLALGREWKVQGEGAFTPKCGPREIIAHWKTHGLPPRPAYDMMMNHDTSRWVWSVYGSDVEPRPKSVYATSCTSDFPSR